MDDGFGVFLFMVLLAFLTVCTLLFWYQPDPINNVIKQCQEVGYYYHGTKTKLVCKVE